MPDLRWAYGRMRGAAASGGPRPRGAYAWQAGARGERRSAVPMPARTPPGGAPAQPVPVHLAPAHLYPADLATRTLPGPIRKVRDAFRAHPRWQDVLLALGLLVMGSLDARLHPHPSEGGVGSATWFILATCTVQAAAL